MCALGTFGTGKSVFCLVQFGEGLVSYGVLVLSWNVSGGEARLLVLIHLYNLLRIRRLEYVCTVQSNMSFWVLDANRMQSWMRMNCTSWWTSPQTTTWKVISKWSQSAQFQAIYLVIP